MLALHIAQQALRRLLKLVMVVEHILHLPEL